jgi:hypothetical protein
MQTGCRHHHTVDPCKITAEVASSTQYSYFGPFGPNGPDKTSVQTSQQLHNKRINYTVHLQTSLLLVRYDQSHHTQRQAQAGPRELIAG